MDGLAIDEQAEKDLTDRIFGKRSTSNKENGENPNLPYHL